MFNEPTFLTSSQHVQFGPLIIKVPKAKRKVLTLVICTLYYLSRPYPSPSLPPYPPCNSPLPENANLNYCACWFGLLFVCLSVCLCSFFLSLPAARGRIYSSLSIWMNLVRISLKRDSVARLSIRPGFFNHYYWACKYVFQISKPSPEDRNKGTRKG